MRDHAAKMQQNSINTMLHIKSELNSGKRKHQTDDTFYSSPPKRFYTETITEHNIERNNIIPATEIMTDYDRYEYIDDSKKSSRACKGKRYQEFMTTGKLQQTPKKTKIKSSTQSNVNGMQSLKKLDIPSIKGDNLLQNQDRDKSVSALSPNDSDGAGKLYDASDFHLEEKIKQLPSLNLEVFLAKKRETKKKKRVGSKYLV